MPQFDTHELAWAAGLFDGEGTIGVRRSGKQARLRRIAMAIGMTHRPAVQRFCSAVRIGKVYDGRIASSRSNAKPVHLWAVYNHEHTQYVVALLWNYLSPEKKEQAKAALLAWKTERHGTSKEQCVRGHNLNETRRKTPGGDNWCLACKRIRTAKYRKGQVA